MKKKYPKPFGDDYELVKKPNGESIGHLLDSLWLKKDGSELIVKMATGEIIRHKPIG